MKAKDLIKRLEKYPEYKVEVSVDISKNESEYDRRAFGEEVIETTIQNRKITICFDGYDNYNKLIT